MFDDEKIEDGVTLRVYRFDSQMNGSPLLSMMLRMAGPKTDKGNAVMQPILKAEKERALENLKAAEKLAVIPRWCFWKKADPELLKEISALKGKCANPLFDFPQVMGEQLINEIKAGMQEQGLTLNSTTRKSNGELDEEILHWA